MPLHWRWPPMGRNGTKFNRRNPRHKGQTKMAKDMLNDVVRSYGHELYTDEDAQRDAGLSKDPMANDGDFVIVDINGQTSRKSDDPER
jgi:hypothetical protein